MQSIVAYYRESNLDCHSIAEQRAAIRAWAEKHDCEIVAEFRERGRWRLGGVLMWPLRIVVRAWKGVVRVPL
jgi:hypothetical protein